MEISSTIGAEGKLTAVVIRANGTREYLGELLPTFWQKARRWLLDRRKLLFGAVALTLLGALLGPGGLSLLCFGLVTTAGVNYMAADFISGGATPTISGMKYHDCGTGVTAAAIGDTALQTAAGTARVIGTPTNPSANIYKTVATIAFTSTLAITEWGLFSASATGTLWDHRVFSAINVNNGDSIQFTYQLTIAAGGT